MRLRMLTAIGLMTSLAVPAMAQDDRTLKDGPKPAIKTRNDAPPMMPVPGKTSFTADQAADRMAKRGYNLTSLPIKDNQGIWYADGQKRSGETVQVMMDYQGNIFEGRGSDAEGADHRTQPASGPEAAPTETASPKPVSPQAR